MGDGAAFFVAMRGAQSERARRVASERATFTDDQVECVQRYVLEDVYRARLCGREFWGAPALRFEAAASADNQQKGDDLSGSTAGPRGASSQHRRRNSKRVTPCRARQLAWNFGAGALGRPGSNPEQAGLLLSAVWV